MPLSSTSVIASNPPSPAKVDKRRGTLLIVDDEEGPRQSLRVVFKEDHNLLLASDGLQAIELARKHKIDAAVIDIRMTGMSGIEVLEKIKAIQPEIQVIMLTAYETTETVRQALRLGASDYLNKPFDVATIRKAVATAMERHSLADEIRANNERLAELQAELQNQKLQEEITRTRGEIYASIIHDINGPLTVMLGFISLIEQFMGNAERLEKQDLEMVKDSLKRITQQVSICIEISRRYLGFLRQRASGASRSPVNQILEDLRHSLNVHPSKGNNRLEIRSLPEDVTVQINGTDFIQILVNLAVNALQCSETAHLVEISGQVRTQPLNLSGIVEGPHDRTVNMGAIKDVAPVLHLSIRDTGPGIPPEVMPKIFDPYFSTKPSGKSTGLGLSIVQRLLLESKGALHLHSVPGQGTTFHVFLPACWQAEGTAEVRRA